MNISLGIYAWSLRVPTRAGQHTLLQGMDRGRAKRVTQHGEGRKGRPRNSSGMSGVPEVYLDTLSDMHRGLLMEARAIYLKAGGKLDEYWEPMLLRFIVNHDWTLSKKAITQLQDTARWRATSGADEIREKLLSGNSKFVDLDGVLATQRLIWFLPCHGCTRAGDPVSYYFLRSFDVAVWLKTMTDQEHFQYNLALLEVQGFVNDQLSHTSRRLVRQVNVIDCHGMGLKHISPAGLRRIQPCLPLADLYYPEMIRCSVILNTPWIFTRAYGLIRSFFSAEMQARNIITARSETVAVLDNLIGLESVPCAVADGGGSCTRMPRRFAEMMGFTDLSTDTLQTLLIHQRVSRGGDASYVIVSPGGSVMPLPPQPPPWLPPRSPPRPPPQPSPDSLGTSTVGTARSSGHRHRRTSSSERLAALAAMARRSLSGATGSTPKPSDTLPGRLAMTRDGKAAGTTAVAVAMPPLSQHTPDTAVQGMVENDDETHMSSCGASSHSGQLDHAMSASRAAADDLSCQATSEHHGALAASSSPDSSLADVVGNGTSTVASSISVGDFTLPFLATPLAALWPVVEAIIDVPSVLESDDKASADVGQSMDAAASTANEPDHATRTSHAANDKGVKYVRDVWI